MTISKLQQRFINSQPGLLFHIAWDLLPLALDRVLAGELDWHEVPSFINYQLHAEAGFWDDWFEDDAPYTLAAELYVDRHA